MSAHASFRDPWGLARRMLTSGEPTARAAVTRTAVTPLLTPLDRWLARTERQRIDAVAPDAVPSAPLLLVVGAPRSGTTLVTQTIVTRLSVSYPTNLGAAFTRAPITAEVRWGSGRPPPSPHAPQTSDARSYYGQTRHWSGHNDAFGIWDRWLGTHRYAAPDSLTESTVAELRRFVAAWQHAMPAPLVNKNNRNTDCIELLASALPSAHFLLVRRDRRATETSLLRARRLVHGDVRHAWGLRSRDALDADDARAAVSEQLDTIEARVAAARLVLPTDRITVVDFESFCTDPTDVVARCAARLGVAPPERPIPEFRLEPGPRRPG